MQERKILIINSKNENNDWSEYFSLLSSRGFELSIMAKDQSWQAFAKSKAWSAKSYSPLIKINKKNSLILALFLLLRPLMFFQALFFAIKQRFSKKINIFILFNETEQLHLSWAARLCGIKALWIIEPENCKKNSALFRFQSAWASHAATVITFTEICLEKLSASKPSIRNIKHLRIGLSAQSFREQKSIFQTLADRNKKEKDKRYFTIGTIEKLGQNKKHLELVFHAIKKCQELIPDIQLVIAGDGPERKRLSWMARKMGIGNLVWFVGNYKNPQKWLANFDIYLSVSPNPTFDDLHMLLLALSDSLPVITSAEPVYGEFVKDGETGLSVDIDQSEALTRALMDLQQNKHKCNRLGKNGSEWVNQRFRLEESAESLIKILES